MKKNLEIIYEVGFVVFAKSLKIAAVVCGVDLYVDEYNLLLT